MFLISEAYAAVYGATTTADTYKITVTRIELCASGSTKTACSNSAVIFNGDSGAIDIAIPNHKCDNDVKRLAKEYPKTIPKATGER